MDIDIFRIVQRYLTKCNADFHTLLLPEDRVLKVIIKGRTDNISESEISDELKAKGYDIKSVQFANFTRKFPINLITLASNPGRKLIFHETPQGLAMLLQFNIKSLLIVYYDTSCIDSP